MLQIVIPGTEYYDEINEEFITFDETVLHLEHSLVSISKWEAKYQRSFLAHSDKTSDELMYYIHCMCQEDVDDRVLNRLTREHVTQIKEYIENPMSATYINHFDRSTGPKDTVTSELIYYWMTALQIPWECQYWHLNRLLTLIEVCNIKNNAATSKSKMSKADILRRNEALNAARRKMSGSKG